MNKDIRKEFAMAENNQNEFYGVVIGAGEYYFDKAYDSLNTTLI